MTIETTWFVRLPETLKPAVLGLHKNARAASRRAAKLPPGDRTEAIRYEGLHAAIDQLALSAIAAGEPYLVVPTNKISWDSQSCVHISVSEPSLPPRVKDWLNESFVVVELNVPHAPGPTVRAGTPGLGPPPAARRWSSGTHLAKDAMRERFDFLLSEALDGEGVGEAVIRPSGITNSVLTEALRREAAAQIGRPPVNLPVQYADTSIGAPFPLRNAHLVAPAPTVGRRLNLTLLSIRHVEMDHLVDGAWFRNSKISLPRPHSLTDQVAYETSRRQLMMLDPSRPVHINLYQTGFEPPVIGFYRALLHHLAVHPGSVSVTPQFYLGRERYQGGTPWATA